MIHILVEEDRCELLEFILVDCKIKADPNLVDPKTLLTPLCAAIQQVNCEIVELLIKYGADVNEPADDMTPLMWAASCGNIDNLKLLCESDADLNKLANKENVYGSPIHMACLCNHYECLEFLLNLEKPNYHPL